MRQAIRGTASQSLKRTGVDDSERIVTGPAAGPSGWCLASAIAVIDTGAANSRPQRLIKDPVYKWATASRQWSPFCATVEHPASSAAPLNAEISGKF